MTHDLLTEPTLALKQAAPMFGAGRSVYWLRDQIRDGKVYPVFRANRKAVEVFACAITDWKARMMSPARFMQGKG